MSGSIGVAALAIAGVVTASTAQVARPLPFRMAVTDLIAIPDRMVTFDPAPGWTVARPNPKITIKSRAALQVTRARSALGPACGHQSASFTDRIDLTLVRKNGFAIVSARAEPVAPPFATQPAAAGPFATVEADRIAVTVDIVRAPMAAMLPARCWAGYRLFVTVRGPAGVDPLTGGKVGKFR